MMGEEDPGCRETDDEGAFLEGRAGIGSFQDKKVQLFLGMVVACLTSGSR